MTDATPKKPKDLILAAGTMQRDETDSGWCNDCAKGSIWYGLAYLLMSTGVDVWGTVRFCTECKKRVWKDKKGIIRNVVKSDAIKEKDVHMKKEEEDVD